MKSKVWRPLRWPKKTLLPARAFRQATFSSSQICKAEQKPYCLLWKGDGMIISSWINAQNILFQLPNVKNYIVWGPK